MPLQEEVMQYLEEHIPELAQAAVTQAHWQTLAAGRSVLVSEGGVIYEVFPDGTRKEVKTIETAKRVPRGAKRILP